MFGNAGGHIIQNIALMDFGQGLHGIVLFLRLEGSLEQLFNGFPSVLNDGLPLGFELVALAGERDLRFCVGVLLAGRTQKAHPDKIEDFLLRLRKRRNILLFKLDGRENGMVICDLAVVGYAGNVRSDRNAGEKRKLAADNRNDLTGGVLHIVRDELAVRARIGQELLFVECLYEIERLLGGEAVVAVRLALQGGQIIELRRIDGFRLPLERRNDGFLFLASRRNFFCFLFGFDLFQISGQITLADMDVEILLLLECGDFPVTLHQHCKGRRLDAPDHQLLVIERGEKAGAVDTDNPVCLRAAECRFIETVKFLAVPEMIEAFADGGVLQRADPQTLEGLGASGFVVDQPEDQLTLASCIGCADQLGDALVLHESGQHLELLCFVLRDLKHPAFRNNGQIVIPPLGIPLIVGAGVCQLHQMTEAPRNDVIAALHIAVLAGRRAQHLCDGLGNAGLFSND